MKIVIFDTETTGMPSPDAPLEKQPYICQFAALLYEYLPEHNYFQEIKRINQLIKPPIPIPPEHIEIHGISDELVKDQPSFAEFADQMIQLFRESDIAIAHNLAFDQAVIENELERLGRSRNFLPAQNFDSMKETKDLCRLPGRSGNYKLPRLMELHQFLLGETFENAHNAIADVEALARCVKKLISQGFYKPVLNSNKISATYSEQSSLF